MCVQDMVKDSPGPVGAESFSWPFLFSGDWPVSMSAMALRTLFIVERHMQ